MGLIKASIMTGGMIYAVNKFTKAMEQRNETNSSNRTYNEQNLKPQDYNYRGLPPSHNVNDVEAWRYRTDESMRSYSPPPNYTPQEYSGTTNEKPHWRTDEYQPQPQPPYGSSPVHPAQQYVPSSRAPNFGSGDRKRSSGLESLVGLAMNYVEGAESSQGKHKRGSSKSVQDRRKSKGRKRS